MPPLPLLPTSLVGSYAQPDWLIDREKLAGRFPPRTRMKELWRVPEQYLEQAWNDATVYAIAEQERAGLDIEMPFRQQRAVALGDAIARGELAVDIVDEAVGRIVATLLRFAPQIAERPSLEIVGCAAHRTLALDTAVRSAVLLRNEGGLLPVEVGDTELDQHGVDR